MARKGMAGSGDVMTKLIGALIAVVLIAALGGTIFGSSGLNNSAFTAAAPAWVVTVLPVIAGAGLIFLLWRATK